MRLQADAGDRHAARFEVEDQPAEGFALQPVARCRTFDVVLVEHAALARRDVGRHVEGHVDVAGPEQGWPDAAAQISC